MQHNLSHLVENNLYSATSMNFLGSEPVLLRSSSVTIRTEFKSSWLNGELYFTFKVFWKQVQPLMFHFLLLEPTFVSMTQIPESQMSAVGDDDKVYLFFSEVAVECDCHNKLLVSRVSRVCKVNGFIQQQLLYFCCLIVYSQFYGVDVRRETSEVRGRCRKNGHPS